MSKLTSRKEIIAFAVLCFCFISCSNNNVGTVNTQMGICQHKDIDVDIISDVKPWELPWNKPEEMILQHYTMASF